MTTPNIIGGALPFGSGGASMDFSGSPAGLASSYAGAYNSALGMNAANYQNILQGYQQTQAAQTSAQDAIQGGYTGLYNNVLAGIQGVGQSQAQAITDAYTQQSGQAAQGLISRGLGNSTVANSVQRGISLDQSKAQTALANQIAQLYAGYQSNLGLAGLNYQNQAAMQNTALNSQQLGWMNSVNAGYPQAGMYAQLAQMYGQGQQGAADRDMMFGGGSGAMGATMGGGGRGTTGYTPGGTGGATGRPTPGTFGGGVSSGSALGGSGTIQAIPGNYTGMGTPQGVDFDGQYAMGYDLSQDEPTNLDWLNNAYQTATYDQYANGYDLSDYYGDMG
jgi:hypothetical protein